MTREGKARVRSTFVDPAIYLAKAETELKNARAAFIAASNRLDTNDPEILDWLEQLGQFDDELVRVEQFLDLLFDKLSGGITSTREEPVMWKRNCDRDRH